MVIQEVLDLINLVFKSYEKYPTENDYQLGYLNAFKDVHDLITGNFKEEN